MPLDPTRSALVLAFLAREGLVGREDVLAPRAASMQDIRRAHADQYLESLHDPGVLENILGTRIPESQIDDILDAHRLMVGGTIAAAKIALTWRTVGVNLGGGFHHARPDRGHGFCVFNDLAIAVEHLRKTGFTGRVLIVDLDLHDGDGTRLAFAKDPTVHTFSIHNHTWSDAPAAEATVIALGSGFDDARLLDALGRALPPVIDRFDPELVLYVAGTDPAADDRLGDAKLTARGMLERDAFVLDQLRPRAMAIVLGGGYGPDSWRYTARLLSLVLLGRALEPPSTDELQLERMRYLARLMTPEALSGGGTWTLTDEDLEGALGYVSPRRSRVLGFYTRHGVELALERLGFLDRLRALGFRQPVIDVELSGDRGDLVRLFGDSTRHELLVEIRLRRDSHLVPGHEVLFVEWLLLQNPRLRFTTAQPPMPGQAHPGLGLLAEVMGLLRLVCDRLNLEGIAMVPGHYHVAARARAPVGFVDPAVEAHFRALKTALTGFDLVRASWAIAEGHVLDTRTGHAVQWVPKPCLIPLTDALARDAFGEAWQRQVEAALPTYQLDQATQEELAVLRGVHEEVPPAQHADGGGGGGV